MPKYQIDRADRLAELVAQARQLRDLARPTTAYVLRILDALTEADIAVLGRWQLRDSRGEAVVDRLSQVLADDRSTVRRALSHCLEFDVYGDYDQYHAAVLQGYHASGEADAAIERELGRPRGIYSFLLHGGISLWWPEREDYSWLTIEDDRWASVCAGFLVAKGRAFTTKLALMETSLRHHWRRWEVLWRWF